MVEEHGKEEALRGIHPVLPSLALAFKRMVAAIERETGVAGMKWFLLTVLGRSDGLSQGEFTQEYEMDPRGYLNGPVAGGRRVYPPRAGPQGQSRGADVPHRGWSRGLAEATGNKRRAQAQGT